MNKSEIRKKILKLRQKKFNQNCKVNFKSILKIFKNKNIKAKTLGGYYPYNYEFNAIEILEKFEKKNYNISLPKIRKNFQMDFFNWSTMDPLSINKFGIPEPISNRIGYGGGFYDRYIKKIRKKKNIITIGLAYSFQKVKKIPTNEYDIKLDYIVTDKQAL